MAEPGAAARGLGEAASSRATRPASWPGTRSAPSRATSEHGAVLKIYNDEPVDYTHYDGANLTSDRAPGNGLVVAGGPNPDNETYTVKFKPGAGTWTAARRRAGAGRKPARHSRGPRRGPRRDHRSGCRCGRPPRNVQRGSIPTSATPRPSIRPKPPSTATRKPAGPRRRITRIRKWCWPCDSRSPCIPQAGSVMTVRLHHDSEYRRATTGRFRLALSSGEYAWPGADKGKELPDAALRGLREPEDKRTPQQRAAIEALYQWTSPGVQPEAHALARLELEAALLERAIPHVVVAEATIPRETRVLPRGNWMDETGALVEPAVPAFLGKLETGGKPRHAPRPRQLAGVARESADGPRVRQPHLARILRHRHLQDAGRHGLAGRMARPTRSCSTGWPPSSCSRSTRPPALTPGTCSHVIRTIVTSQTYRAVLHARCAG